MGRAPCCDKANVKKGPWSPEEDTKLKEYIEKHGTGGNWIALPHKAGLKRCGKSCRLRWLNYLRPNIKHGDFSHDEDRIICSLFVSIGSRWSIIAAQLPGRTDNDIKNYWNTKLKKKLLGIPPSQRKPNQQHHQLLFQSSLQDTAPPPSTLGSCKFNPPKPLLAGLEGFPAFSSDLLTIFHHVQQVPMHQYLGFNGDQSCSSSDGSCTQISYGKEREFDMGLESYLYGGMDETQNQKLLIGGGGGGGDASLDYNYEDIKELVIPNNGCDIVHLDDPTTGTTIEDNSFNTQGRVTYYY